MNRELLRRMVPTPGRFDAVSLYLMGFERVQLIGLALRNSMGGEESNA